jgi:hypothetical protein
MYSSIRLASAKAKAIGLKPLRSIPILLGAAMVLGAALPAAAEEFIANGGFEDGSTPTGFGNTVPNDWTPAASYASEGFGFNQVVGSPHSGAHSLQIGNFDGNPATISQAFTDQAGALYTVNFYGFAGSSSDPDAFLTVSAGAGSLTFTEPTSTYTLGAFTFVGSGSDTLTISAQTAHSEWFVDDVSVTGPAAATGGVPEPASWAMMIVGFGMAGTLMRRRKLVRAI